MKRLTLAFLAAAAVALSLGANLGAQDQPARLAFVDSQALIALHPAGVQANQLRELAATEIGDLRTQLDGLRAKEASSGLTPEEQDLVSVLLTTYQSVQARYQAEIATTAQPAIEAVNAAIRQVAEENGIAVVMDIAAAAEGGLVVYAAEGLDLTDVVAQRLQ